MLLCAGADRRALALFSAALFTRQSATPLFCCLSAIFAAIILFSIVVVFYISVTVTPLCCVSLCVITSFGAGWTAYRFFAGGGAGF